MTRSASAWSLALLVAAVTAATVVGGARPARPESIQPRDPAKLSDIDAELILNRIREGDLVAIKGDLDGARVHWRTARHKGQGYWPIHEALGDSLARHRLEAEAESEYETAGRIAEKQLGRAPVALNLKRAGLLIRLKRPEPALRLLIECAQPEKLAEAIVRILKESPGLVQIVKQAADVRDPRLWAIVASVTADPADRASALGRYVRSVAPADGNLAAHAVEELRTHQRLDEALLVCSDWAKAAPSDPAAYETWGRLLAAAGNRDRARLVLSTIVDVKPGDPAAHARLGSALRDLGEYPDAIRQFEEVSRLRPEEPGGMQEIVATLLAQGNFEAASTKTSELMSRKWDPRFGDVAAGFRSLMARECLKRIDEAKRAGKAETAQNLRRLAADFGFLEAGLFDIRIVMTWDASTDVDLDVTEPGGETINHGKPRSRSGAIYHYDNTQGLGPEHYTLRSAPKGNYKVGAHLHGSGRSTVDIEVILFEETARERRLKGRVTLDGKTRETRVLEFEVP